MKTIFKFCLLAYLTTIGLICSAQTAIVPAATPFTLVGRGANSDILQQTWYEATPTGQATPHTQQVTVFGTGRNYWDGSAWTPSDPTFQISQDGGYVYAEKLQNKVRLSANLANSNSVVITTASGLVIDTAPVAVGLYDAISGNSVIIAAITNCTGILVNSNQVLYENAFDGVSGDIVYTLQSGSFSQDVVWKQDIDPADYGFPTNSTRIQIFTAVNSSAPKVVERPLQVEKNQVIRSEMASPDFIDHTLTFGQLKFGPGHAFLAASTNTLGGAPIAKDFQTIDGQPYLVESVKYADIENDLAQLPRFAVSTQATAKLIKNVHRHYGGIPSLRCATKATISRRGSRNIFADAVEKKGVVADYVALPATEPDPMIFQGDTTYFVDGLADFDDVIFEGGTVVKYPNNTNAEVEVDGTLTCETGTYLPAIFTAADDDSVGTSMNGIWPGYTGTVRSGGYGNPALYITGSSATLTGLRICDAVTGVNAGNGLNVRDMQVVNCGLAFDTFVEIGFFENVLIANSGTAFYGYDGTWFVENATIANCGQLLGSSSPLPTRIFLFNSLLANVTNLVVTNGYNYATGTNDGFYNCNNNGIGADELGGITTTVWPFKTVCGGSYYLTNNTFRGQGTTNGIDTALVADLAAKSTWPPLIYTSTNISSLGSIHPQAIRDTNIDLDIGYHYDPIDWIFGACQLHTNLTVTAGTAVGWAGVRGIDGKDGTNQPFGLLLSDGANLSINGTPVQNCFYVNYIMAQEGTTNWNSAGYMGGMIFNGTNSSPQLNATFTIWTIDSDQYDFFRDDWDYGVASFHDCEFYDGGIGTYEITNVAFANCLFFRDSVGLWGYHGVSATSVSCQTCTFYNGCLVMDRSAGEWPSFWQIENTAFDGTAFSTSDNYSGSSSYTLFNYNAYNTNNSSWQSYTNVVPTTNTLEVVGPNDLLISSYYWEGSWFGNFYLPSYSPLINAGSTTADQLGLYEFTTQTNQVPETNSIVDIGYHYLATNLYGNPLETYVPGIPNYIVDPQGNGVLNGLDSNGLQYFWEYSYFGQIGVNPDATDPDGLETIQDFLLGLSPVTDQSSQTGSRSNYSYTLADWLNAVSGVRNGSITLDNEGNVQSVSQ